MIGVLASSAVYRGFERGRVKPNNKKLASVASPLSRQHYGVRAKLARNQNNVSEWSDMSTCGLLFQ